VSVSNFGGYGEKVVSGAEKAVSASRSHRKSLNIETG
jgi:hypothetical protein